MKLLAFTVEVATAVDGYPISGVVVNGMLTMDGYIPITEFTVIDPETSEETVIPITGESVFTSAPMPMGRDFPIGLDTVNAFVDTWIGSPFLVVEDGQEESIPSYTDISSIETWASYGANKQGTLTNLRDWKCVQREIYTLAVAKAGAPPTWSTWDTLSEAEARIVCAYLPARVPSAKLAISFPQETAIQQEVYRRMIRYAASESQKALQARYFEFALYLADNLQLADSAAVLDELASKLRSSYFSGIESKSATNDGTSGGLLDYVAGTAGTDFAGAGLPAKVYTPKTLANMAAVAAGAGQILNGYY